jgi:cell division protein FtsI/penicillin-binding protein 2
VMSERFDSASGLRPVSAFALIGCVIVLVVGRVAWLATWGPESRAPRVRVESDPEPSGSIHDRDGRPMAVFVQRLDLVLSPNALWQAHTPDALTRSLSAALGGSPTAAELLAAMLPDARRGVVVASDPADGSPLAFTREQARAVDDWARRGGFGEEASGLPIDGIWLEQQRGGAWHLCWSPTIALSEGMRARHVPARRHNPLAWTRVLADGLARCLLGEAALEPGPGVDARELERQREGLWRILIPTTYAVAVRDFDARRAPDVAALLAGERVAHHQMSIARDRAREYPGGRDELLGFWGWIDEASAERSALVQAGFARADVAAPGGVERLLAGLSPDERARHVELSRALVTSQQPLTGLERAAARLLDEPRWDFLQHEPARFGYWQQRPVGETARPYYLDAQPASETPRVVTTIDALLQRFVDDELARVMEEHQPAVAMAIALDVASGDVLAVGSRNAYPSSGWAPLHHQVLPGSTFKVVVMASALDSGAVRPHDVFDIGNGREYRLQGRTIREAELSNRSGVQTAAQCLAYSINAGLVQIGLRMSAETLRGYLAALHYGVAPSTGLGGERAGHLPALPWHPVYAHASVSYGYETQVTLWQHAAALASVVRGGEWLPLRLLDAVEQRGRRWVLAAAEPQRVFGERACAEVREMMRMGAREGTGMRVASPELLPGLDVGTKTGTAERVGSELCIHVELQHQAAHAEAHTRCSRDCRRAAKSLPKPHRGACVTLSMAAFGRRLDGEREVLVLVMVDEPVHKARYGSDTAGPAAVAILKEALGVTALGQERRAGWIAGFGLAAGLAQEAGAQPWAEVDG